MADDNQEALAMVKVYPIENPLPEDLEAVLTTATYVNPRFRGQRLTKRMLLEAHQTAKLIYSERTKPLAFFSQLAIPNTPTYQGLREKMSEMLESMDYHPLDEEAGFFMKLVN